MIRYVYMIGTASGSAVKVGSSKYPQVRLADLQTAHHETLSLLGVLPASYGSEKKVHARLSAWRMRGEWYRPEGAVRELMGCLVPLPGKPVFSGSTLAERLASARKCVGISVAELAKRVRVSRQAVYLIESGQTRDMRADTAIYMARALGVPFGWLVTGEE